MVVTTGPLPWWASTLDTYVQGQMQDFSYRSQIGSFRQISLISTVIGGRQAEMVEFERKAQVFEEAELEEVLDPPLLHNLIMYMVAGNSVWAVDFGIPPTEFSDFEDTFYEILSTFRILE